MIPLILTAVVAAFPFVFGLLFRVHAVHIFSAIAGGYLLQYALSDDFDLAFATVIQGSNAIVVSQIVLLLLPVVLTIFFLRRTQGNSLLFQFVPLVFSGMLLATLMLPLTPPEFMNSVYESEYGSGIKGSQDLVIAGAVISNMLAGWMLYKSPKSHKKHH